MIKLMVSAGTALSYSHSESHTLGERPCNTGSYSNFASISGSDIVVGHPVVPIYLYQVKPQVVHAKLKGKSRWYLDWLHLINVSRERISRWLKASMCPLSLKDQSAMIKRRKKGGQCLTKLLSLMEDFNHSR